METLPETFVHPAGFCQNVLGTGRCWVTGSALAGGREAIVLRMRSPANDRIGRGPPRLSPRRSRSDRETGVILRFTEAIGGERDPHAEVVEFAPDAPLPATALQFVFPTGTTMLY